MALLTHAELIEALGGGEAAQQLLDPNRTGQVDDGMLDGAIADAEGDVEAAHGARFLAIVANPSKKIRRIMRQLACYYAWFRGPKNLVMPDLVKQGYGSARQDLKEIEASLSGPGGNPASRFPTTIDNSQGGRRAVFSTWRRGGINGGR